METIRQDTHASKSARGKKYQEAIKITDVPYIYGYVENKDKPVNEDSLSLRSPGLTISASS